jgi:NDP-mannose synthase
MNDHPPFEAVILAGGEGTRLKPYTTVLPKPLMPVGGRPILGIIIDQLQRSGATKITLAVNYMAELITAVLGNGAQYGVPITYSREGAPMGTIAPLKLIDTLPERFLVMNGDVLTKLDPAELYRSHCESACRLTIASCHREVKIDFGVLEIDPQTERLVGHREKPTYEFNVSMGMYVMDRSLLDEIPPATPYGVDSLALDMLRRGDPINVYRYRGFWLDLGRPSDFEAANREFDIDASPANGDAN